MAVSQNFVINVHENIHAIDVHLNELQRISMFVFNKSYTFFGKMYIIYENVLESVCELAEMYLLS